MLDETQYLQQRIDDQIAWYDRKSSRNKRSYQSLRLLSIAIALSIPIMSGFIGKGHDDIMKVALSVAGALVALLEGLLSLFKFQDNWIQYRTTGENLKYHKFLFETRAVPYHEADAFSRFVQCAEELMARERLSWFQSNQSQTPGKTPEDRRG